MTQSGAQRHGRLELQERDHGPSQSAEDLGDDRRRAGGEDDEVAGSRRRALDQVALLGLGEELDDRAAQRAPLLDVHVGHAFGAVLLGQLREGVDLCARESGAAGRAQGAHHAAALERRRNTWNPLPANTSLSSAISSAKRRSGLSVP